MGNGDSKVADQAIADAGFPEALDEQVLIQGKGSINIGDRAFSAAVRDVERRLRTVRHEPAGSHEVHLAVGSRQTPLPQRILGRDPFWYLDASGPAA